MFCCRSQLCEAKDAVLVARATRLVISLAAAAATTVTIVTAAAAAVSATAGWTAFTFTSFVARNFAVAEGRLIEALDGCSRFLGIAHFHEAEATGSTGFAVGDDANLGHIAVLRERITQFALGSTK